MHQISRSFANAVLYKGKIVKNWTGLYSESVTNFPELRGFDCTAITKAGVFEGKTADANTVEYGTAWVTTYGNTATVISNNGLAAVNAVNDLLAKASPWVSSLRPAIITARATSSSTTRMPVRSTTSMSSRLPMWRMCQGQGHHRA